MNVHKTGSVPHRRKYSMKYILCSVLWTDSDLPPGYAASAICAASVPDEKNGSRTATYKCFSFENYESQADELDDFLNFCTDEFMLCLWDGFSAGRMKKLFDLNGRRHPYVHLYHLKKVSELTKEKCTDIRKKKMLESRLSQKPLYRKDISSAENEVKWLVSLFDVLDLSVMEKKPAVDFIDQPSNVYFVFKNGKCFHTNKCRIVRDAPVQSLRSYTYYSTVTEAGFTPCSKCKPENLDEQTVRIMKKINAEKYQEAMAEYAAGKTPKPRKKRKKSVDVYRSLAHMCGMYALSYEKKGKNVYICTDKKSFLLSPEETPVKLSVKNRKGEYKPMKKTFPDPYEAVREIIGKSKGKTK